MTRNPHSQVPVVPCIQLAAPRWSRRAGAIAAAAGMVFVGLVSMLQWYRSDLGWIHAQLSAYLHGPYGLLLRTAYCLLAVAMAWLALGLYAALVPAARSRAVLGLFWSSALGLCAVAIGDSWMPELAPNAAAMVHVLAADATFLCVIAAILLQSWYFRSDRAWRQHFAATFGLGWAAFAALLFHVSVPAAPPGISQKTAIVLIVIWMVRVGMRLARVEAAGPTHSRNNGPINQP